MLPSLTRRPCKPTEPRVPHLGYTSPETEGEVCSVDLRPSRSVLLAGFSKSFLPNARTLTFSFQFLVAPNLAAAPSLWRNPRMSNFPTFVRNGRICKHPARASRSRGVLSEVLMHQSVRPVPARDLGPLGLFGTSVALHPFFASSHPSSAGEILKRALSCVSEVQSG